MTRTLVYIAAPYGDPIPEIRRWNVARAVALGRVWQAKGYAPIVVHTSVEFGVYGCDESPEERAAGLESSLAIVEMVVRAGGTVAALLRDNGEASAGVKAEIIRAGVVDPMFWFDPGTWEKKRSAFVDTGLLDLWESLRDRPVVPR